MSKSSYYYVEQTNKKEDKYKTVRTLLKEIFSKNYKCYGYRRLHTALKKMGHFLSEKVIRRLMKEEKIKVIKCRKKRYSSYLGELSPAVENIVNRDHLQTRNGLLIFQNLPQAKVKYTYQSSETAITMK